MSSSNKQRLFQKRNQTPTHTPILPKLICSEISDCKTGLGPVHVCSTSSVKHPHDFRKTPESHQPWHESTPNMSQPDFIMAPTRGPHTHLPVFPGTVEVGIRDFSCAVGRVCTTLLMNYSCRQCCGDIQNSTPRSFLHRLSVVAHTFNP